MPGRLPHIFFQNPLSSGKGHAKAFLNRNENMKNNFCMSRTNARSRSDQIAHVLETSFLKIDFIDMPIRQLFVMKMLEKL